MVEKTRKYKRREDFTDEEWRKLRIKALKLNIERGWGNMRIARELGISHNTVASWLYDYRRLGRIGEFKRRGNFNDEEWKEIVTEAWRLRAEKGWGRVKIAKKLGISPNTIGPWINRKPPDKVIHEYGDAFRYWVIDTKRIIKEEMEKGITEREEGEEMLKNLDFYYSLSFYYPRAKRIEKEGDDSHLIYS